MLKEIIEYLRPEPGKTIVDATVGTGGHSLAIAERILPGGRLICIDRDEESLGVAKYRLKSFGASCDFIYGNFSQLESILDSKNINSIDGIIFDLGVSSFQLDNPQRGFSFQNEGPLDMRLDRNSYISAYDLVNNLNEEELSAMLWNFGQERWHNRIAHLLVEERQRHPIATTVQLVEVVNRAMPRRYRFRHYRIHPATRTFQAVRIAVNRELEILGSSVMKAIDYLAKDARICVISFHSLEDRIVKNAFKLLSGKSDGFVNLNGLINEADLGNGKFNILTKKPLTAGSDEVARNPRSRSAKLRVLERVA